MRYWHPFTEEALEEAAALRPARLVALSLYPHYSRAVGGSSVGELNRRCAPGRSPAGSPPSTSSSATRSFSRRTPTGSPPRSRSSPTAGRDAFVLFSAHNLPEKLIRQGDPYLDQVRATVDGLLPAIGGRPWRLAFQSRSGPVKWLAPEVAETLRALAAEGRRQVLMVPLRFVSDQIETLHEIDVVYAEEARAAGRRLPPHPGLQRRAGLHRAAGGPGPRRPQAADTGAIVAACAARSRRLPATGDHGRGPVGLTRPSVRTHSVRQFAVEHLTCAVHETRRARSGAALLRGPRGLSEGLTRETIYSVCEMFGWRGPAARSAAAASSRRSSRTSSGS